MAEETPEHQDRGMFGLFGKKKEEEGKKGDHIGQAPHGQTEAGSYYPVAPQHAVQHGQGHSHEEQFNPVETEQQKQKGLKGKPHRTHSSSSSSSSDDEKEGGKKKEGGRKKKGSKEKSKERLPVGGQQYSDEYGRGKEEKKTGIVDKFKEKIPGHQDKLPGEGKQYSSDQRRGEEEKKEGLLDKIKDKFPGHQNKNDGEEEEKEKKHFR